jgi:hypothetical protein
MRRGNANLNATHFRQGKLREMLGSDALEKARTEDDETEKRMRTSLPSV